MIYKVKELGTIDKLISTRAVSADDVHNLRFVGDGWEFDSQAYIHYLIEEPYHTYHYVPATSPIRTSQLVGQLMVDLGRKVIVGELPASALVGMKVEIGAEVKITLAKQE